MAAFLSGFAASLISGSPSPFAASLFSGSLAPFVEQKPKQKRDDSKAKKTTEKLAADAFAKRKEEELKTNRAKQQIPPTTDHRASALLKATAKESVQSSKEHELQKLFKELAEQILDKQSHEDTDGAAESLNTLLDEAFKRDCLRPDTKIWSNVQDLIHKLKIGVLCEALSELQQAAEERRTEKSGQHTAVYKIVALIKLSLPSIHLPLLPLEQCTLDKVIDMFWRKIDGESFDFPTTTKLIQIILSHPSPFSSHLLLGEAYFKTFFDFVTSAILVIPLKEWEDQGESFFQCLRMLDDEGKKKFLQPLLKASDPVWRQIAESFLEGLDSKKSLRQCAPYFHRIKELLPCANDLGFIESIFHRPFPTFEERHVVERNYPACVKRLNFDGSRDVVIFENLMIGVIKDGSQGLIHLIAFDMNTSKLVWGVPIRKENRWMELQPLCPFGIPIINEKSKLLMFLDPKTGEKSLELTLPEAIEPRGDYQPGSDLHILPSGFLYYSSHTVDGWFLFGGQVAEGKFSNKFKLDRPGGICLPLGENLSFQNFDSTCTIVAPNGKPKVVPYAELHLFKNNLYATAKNEIFVLAHKNEPEFEIVGQKSIFKFPTEHHEGFNIKILQICENGVAFCKFAGRHAFVDLERGTHAFLEGLPSNCASFVDREKGSVWSWNERDKQVKKHTMEGTKPLGLMDAARGVSLLHVDKSDRLYMVYIPF